MVDVNTKFNPDGDFKNIETWEAIAINRASQQNVSAKVIMGFLVGGVGVVTGVPAVGGVVAAWLFKSAYDGLATSGTRLKTVRDLGCIAWALDEVDFRTYVRQFGDDAVDIELHRAIASSCELSNFAHNWLRSRREVFPSVEQGRLESRAGLPPAKGLPSSNWIHSFDDGTISQLESALKQSINKSNGESHPIQSKVEVWNRFSKSEIDIVKEAGSTLKNLFLVGLGGSGKGMLLACLLREVRQNTPQRKIFLINGKDDPKEYGYFEGVVNVQKRLNCESATPSTVAVWFEAVIADYDNYARENNGALLVIDEGTIIGARLKAAKCSVLGDKLIGITSSGGSMNKNVWFVAQTPYVGASGTDLSAISQLTPIAIIHKSNLSVLDMWRSAKLFKNFDTEEIVGLVNHSECDRAVYFGKTTKWYSMPSLPNHAGYDRDNQTFIKGCEPRQGNTNTYEQSRTATEVPIEASDDIIAQMIDKLTRSHASTIEEFISRDLSAKSRISELKPAIIKAIRDRTDLLEKLGLGWLSIEDPIEALKHWGAITKSDEEIKEAWLLHTGQHLNDQSIKMVKEKLI